MLAVKVGEQMHLSFVVENRPGMLTFQIKS
jgi:hypothetical protein